jgi:hypothetical protein
MAKSNASELELQIHMDRELNRHYLTEVALREIETHMSIELNRKYRIPEPERQRLKVRDDY